MSLNQNLSKEDSDLISSEYDKYRSDSMDKIDDLLIIDQITEMDSKIHKNCLAILKIMKNIQNKLYNNYELKKEEIENFIYCLKFIDTLNIFMNNSMIDSILKLTEDITNLIHSNNLIKNKDDLLHKIKYAEKSVVYFKKKTFKNLYFSDPDYLTKEIEKSLNSIIHSYEYSNNFDRKIFKQMQNIFWVLQKKLNEEQKKFLQKIIDDLKGINIKSRSRRYTSYYDYNDSQNYYTNCNNYYSNNYYGYSNYNNPGQSRRGDYYDPNYKKVDLVELPEIIHDNQNQQNRLSESIFNCTEENLNQQNNDFDSKEETTKKYDDLDIIYSFENQQLNQDKELFFQNNKNDYNYEKNKIVKESFKLNEKPSSYNKNKRNRFYSKTDEVNSQAKIIKEDVGNHSINVQNQEKEKSVLKVVEVEINATSPNYNEFDDISKIGDNKEISKLSENIETVIVSSRGQKDYNNSNKYYNNYSNSLNNKTSKKHKDLSNQTNQNLTKTEKSETKNNSKKTKKNKSLHLLVEVDFSKLEKSNTESNNEIIVEETNINEKNIEQKGKNISAEAEDIISSHGKMNKDNIEIIRHYQSDYEYNFDYDTIKYGKYISKYQKHYPNQYSKQMSQLNLNKDISNNNDVEFFDKKLEPQKISAPDIKSSNNDDMIVSNFNDSNTTLLKDKNPNNNNNIDTNITINNKYRNKSFSTYNSYTYGGYNNYKNPNLMIQEKNTSERETVLNKENDNKNKYIIQEVEFLDNKPANKNPVENEINNFMNIGKDIDQSLNTNLPESLPITDLLKSNSDLEASLNDLKLLDLKINFQDYTEIKNTSENTNFEKNIIYKDNEDKTKNEEQTNKETHVTYETIKTYVDDHPRYNSGNNYKMQLKNKIGKYGKYHAINNSSLNNTDSINNEHGDNYFKNNYYNNKQTFNQMKDHQNNSLHKNYYNTSDANDYNQKNNENLYEKSNYDTGKKKNYSNNYKPEKNYDISSINNSNKNDSFNNRKLSEFYSKEVSINKENIILNENPIENQSQNKEKLIIDKDYNASKENNEFIEEKKDKLTNDFSNNNNFYSGKGHSNNFNSLNNVDKRENVHNKNYQENGSKIYNKEYNKTTSQNNYNFVQKHDKGNYSINYKKDNESNYNMYQDQNSNYDNIKMKNKKNNNYENDFYNSSKGYKNSRINQNNPNFIINHNKETEDFSTKMRGREEFYDYTNKLNEKKIKNNESNKTNVKELENQAQFDNNFINYDHLKSTQCLDSNKDQNKIINKNNLNMSLYSNFQNNLGNFINSTNNKDFSIKKHKISYKYNSTDIGMMSNLQNFNNKTTSAINTPISNVNNNMNSNFNMFNLGIMNYIHQMNLYNQMNSINNVNSKLNVFPIPSNINQVNRENQELIMSENKSDNIKDNKDDDENNQKSKLIIEENLDRRNEFEKNIHNSETVNKVIEINKEKVKEEKIINNEQIDSNFILDPIHIKTPIDNKPIGIFNMDIEKFFQSEAKDINLINIPQLEKNKDEIIEAFTDSTKIKTENIFQNENFESLSNFETINKPPIDHSNEKMEFTSEQETEKENIEGDSLEENESDEEPSNDTSEDIPNEEIEAAFETFQNEIRHMNSIPSHVANEDEFYVGESDYIDENKETLIKNNKAIFEEEDIKKTKKIEKEIDREVSIHSQKLIDVDMNSNVEENEEEESISDKDLNLKINISDSNSKNVFNIDKKVDENSANIKINEVINIKNNENGTNLKKENLETNIEPDKKTKNVVNNQIYNNFNFFNMQMIPNHNMNQFLNNISSQNGIKMNNNKNINMFNLMEASKLMNMKYGENNLINISTNQNLSLNNLFNTNLKDNKNLREQTKAYTDSIKTIDPDLLKIIKNKLTENTNNKERKDSINTAESAVIINEKISDDFQRKNVNKYEDNDNDQIGDKILQHIPQDDNRKPSIIDDKENMKQNALVLNSNHDFQNTINNEMSQYANILNSGQALNINSVNKNIQLNNYLLSNLANSIFKGRDSNIHREYLSLKYLEQENPKLISRNIEGFEDRVLIPVYQKLIFNVNKRKGVYFFTFNRYRKLICKVLQNSKILKKVKPYGSLMNNFMIDSGDIDICIVPNCGILEFAIYLDKIKEAIISQNIAEHKLTHHTSRYMLLKIQDNQTKFVIDITVHNMLPILNTKLIRMYSIYDQRFHILGLYLKHWSKINKIHGASDNYLSSYALLVMLIHFLQNAVEPKVLPNLQKVEDKNIMYEYNQNGEKIGTNIYFEEDVHKIKQNLLKINMDKENYDSASSLLVKFFEYYSYNYDNYEQKISVCKDKSECFKKNNDNIAFSIEDPFDNFHNPGKSMTINSVQFNKFITAMKKEINFILNGEYLKRLDKVINLNNPNQSAINMQYQIQIQNMQMMNNNSNIATNSHN